MVTTGDEARAFGKEHPSTSLNDHATTLADEWVR